MLHRLRIALLRKRRRVSLDACLWPANVDAKCWTGSSFRPSKRNDAGGEGSVKKERSTGVSFPAAVDNSS